MKAVLLVLCFAALSASARIGDSAKQVTKRYGEQIRTNDLGGMQVSVHNFKEFEIWCIYLNDKVAGEILLSTNTITETEGQAIAERVVGRPLKKFPTKDSERLGNLFKAGFEIGAWRDIQTNDEASLFIVSQDRFKSQLTVIGAALSKKLVADAEFEREAKRKKERSKANGF